MNKILAKLAGAERADEEIVRALVGVVDEQAAEQSLGGSRTTAEWLNHQSHIDQLAAAGGDAALPVLSQLIDSLELYSPALKGLQDVHTFVCQTLEELTFRQDGASMAAAYLYGHSLAMSPVSHDLIQLAIENLLLKNAHETSLCLLLGVKRSNASLFAHHLSTLLRQVQVTAFTLESTGITQDALQNAMKLYTGPTEQSRHIAASTHALFDASLRLTAAGKKRGLFWACFIIAHTPMLLRNQLRAQYAIDADEVFRVLAQHFASRDKEDVRVLCAALPILVTWETSRFCADGHVARIIDYLLALPPCADSFKGLGQIASIILDKFTPYLERVSILALSNLEQLTRESQALLGSLLASLGPVTLHTMSDYLKCPTPILLDDVRLLELMSALLPNLARRIIQGLCGVIDEAVSGKEELLEPILAALTVFPLADSQLASKAQMLVLWTMDESKPQAAILYALQLAVDPYIASSDCTRTLTHKASHLLLADDPHIVHMALSALSNPLLAAVLDEKCCEMILLALHQSLEPSVQIVAAKLLTHLATPHRGIIQPLAWNHIRQSLGLMEFLQTLEPSRAIVEACIISNLLPALPVHVRKRYIHSVKELILVGLERPQEGQTLSLIFQGLANLARFDAWGKSQQTQLAIDLLEMSQEIPRDSQHAALNAIARLLATPQGDVDAYEMLGSVHSTFKRRQKLDPDLKALVSGIYGSLGTVERNPVISRDSKAAILREKATYDQRTKLDMQASQWADHGAGPEWLVANTLQALLNTAKGEDRAALIESLTALAVIQSGRTEQLIPELPEILMRQVTEQGSKTGIVLMAAALHGSPRWLERNWRDFSKTMGACVQQDVRSVFRSVDLILDQL